MSSASFRAGSRPPPRCRRPFLLPCAFAGAALAVTAIVNVCALDETLQRKGSEALPAAEAEADAHGGYFPPPTVGGSAGAGGAGLATTMLSEPL